jgi:hypothetical protein
MQAWLISFAYAESGGSTARIYDNAVDEGCRGPGPAWSNSLFEDNAEFGPGFWLAADQHVEMAHGLLLELAEQLGPHLVEQTIAAPQIDELAQFHPCVRRPLGTIDSFRPGTGSCGLS